MNSPAVDIIDMLEAESSLGLVFPTNIGVGNEPADPANYVTVYDTGGYPPYQGLTTVGYNYPTVQVRVRNTNYQNGWKLTNDIKDTLHGRAQETWSSTLYTLIQAVGDVLHLGHDDRGRELFVINFNIQRR